MDNGAISKVFADVAVLMQARGDNVFKVRAHSKASDEIKSLSYSLADIVDDTELLREIPGFGEAIVGKTQELIRTGRLGLLEDLLEELPNGVLELVQIPGIGPKTAVIAAQELGIGTFEQLVASIESDEFQQLPRISKKGAQQILRHTKMRIEQGDRFGLGPATQIVAGAIEELKTRCPEITLIEVAGSVKRGVELVGDINILCAVAEGADPATVLECFATLPSAHKILSQDASNARIADNSGKFMSIKVVPAKAWAGALVYATGSIAHGRKLEEIAEQNDLVLTEDGLYENGADDPVVAETEADIYDLLNLNFIPPEMREDSNEIELAETSDFSRILKLSDIRGDLHSHTNWSDGRYPLEEMVASAAADRGFEYLAITDHSPSATVANGLVPDMLLAHNSAVKELDKTSELRLLTGTEMDIKPDGSLDYSDELLADLDIVIASIHSGMDQDEATMTQRVIDAMESPHVDIICHLTTRLTERRAAVEIDIEAILNAAVRTGTVMEINASPDRLDLKAEHVRMGVDLGVIFAVNTDSHRTWQFANLRFGVQTAIRGWVESGQVINTLHYAELMAFLALPKTERYAFKKPRG
jgi:DNA polymerase (family 10)